MKSVTKIDTALETYNQMLQADLYSQVDADHFIRSSQNMSDKKKAELFLLGAEFRTIKVMGCPVAIVVYDRKCYILNPHMFF